MWRGLNRPPYILEDIVEQIGLVVLQRFGLPYPLKNIQNVWQLVGLFGQRSVEYSQGRSWTSARSGIQQVPSGALGSYPQEWIS